MYEAGDKITIELLIKYLLRVKKNYGKICYNNYVRLFKGINMKKVILSAISVIILVIVLLIFKLINLQSEFDKYLKGILK